MTRTHIHFGANQEGRDFVCGDLHGMLEALHLAMRKIDFDTRCDRMFSVGDMVDRGPESVACFDLLSEPWFNAVRGNHEQMMIEVWRGREPLNWFLNGGEWARQLAPDKLDRMARRAARLPYAMTIMLSGGRRAGVCHGEPPVDDWNDIGAASADEAGQGRMIWGRSWLKGGLGRRTANVDLTIHGHTPVAEPRRIANALFIDTGCVYGGPLTVLELEAAVEEATLAERVLSR